MKELTTRLQDPLNHQDLLNLQEKHLIHLHVYHLRDNHLSYLQDNRLHHLQDNLLVRLHHLQDEFYDQGNNHHRHYLHEKGNIPKNGCDLHKHVRIISMYIIMKLNQSIPYFQTLANAKTLRDCPQYVTDDLFEILYNIVMNNCPLAKSHHLPVLRKYKQQMLTLINKKTKMSRRKYLHNQDGGFLGALLPIVLGVISSAL